MKPSFSKNKYNTIETMKLWYPDADLSHISYDPDMKKGDYYIIRNSGGDGTSFLH
jgi:hypothetical protein